VVLLEEGPDPRPIPDIIADPKRQLQLIADPDWVRLYPTERADGSIFRLISGRVLGGGSSVNKGGVMRPQPRDFEAWARLGGPAWSYEALLPLVLGLEDDADFTEAPNHGHGGPLKVRRPWTFDGRLDPPMRAIVAAADAAGIPRCLDDAVPGAYGLCQSPYNIVDGRRFSAVNAFLDPARARPNLEIRSETRATRLLLDGGSVRGVEVSGPDGPATVEADRVVVSAGAYQTPHLLLLSGIGPPEKIEAVGLPVRHRLEGVGENFQDHAVVYLTYRATERVRPTDEISSPRLWVASETGKPVPDLHIIFHPVAASDGGLIVPVSARLLEQREPGRIRLASSDPAALPSVEPCILRAPDDLRAMLSGLRMAHGLVQRPELAAFYGDLLRPGPDRGDDWANHALATHVTYNHATGTCRLGPADDPLAVVGPDLRVHGFDNLWLADMSVIPVVPHVATNVTALLVGAIAARNISG
jgi:choline dehydrogenase